MNEAILIVSLWLNGASFYTEKRMSNHSVCIDEARITRRYWADRKDVKILFIGCPYRGE